MGAAELLHTNYSGVRFVAPEGRKSKPQSYLVAPGTPNKGKEPQHGGLRMKRLCVEASWSNGRQTLGLRIEVEALIASLPLLAILAAILS